MSLQPVLGLLHNRNPACLASHSPWCSGMDIVIVHCFLSQQRGPYCAQRCVAR